MEHDEVKRQSCRAARTPLPFRHRWLLATCFIPIAAMLVVGIPLLAFAQTTVRWEALPNSALALHLPSPLPQGSTGPGAIIGGWTSAAFDSKRGQLLVLAAGGHGDYSGNEVYAFREDLGRFERLTEPSPAIVRWPNPSVDVLVDGTPPARHTYGGVGYDPVTDSAFVCGGSRSWDGNPTTPCWRFHLAPLKWENLGAIISSAAGYAGLNVFRATTGVPWLVWDPGALKFLTQDVAGVISYLNLATMKTEPVACSGATNPSAGHNAVLDSSGRQLYMIGNGETRRLDLGRPHTNAYCSWPGSTPNTTDEKLATTGANEIEGLNLAMDGSGGIGLAWDPEAKLVVAYGKTADQKAGRVYSLDPITKVWTAWEANPAGPLPPLPTGTGVWNRFWLHGQCLYVVTATSLPVYRACSFPWRGLARPPSSSLQRQVALPSPSIAPPLHPPEVPRPPAHVPCCR